MYGWICIHLKINTGSLPQQISYGSQEYLSRSNRVWSMVSLFFILFEKIEHFNIQVQQLPLPELTNGSLLNMPGAKECSQNPKEGH